MRSVHFFVDCLPVAQPRPRVVSMGGKARAISAPSSHAIHDFKAIVRLASRKHVRAQLTGPVSLAIDFRFPRTKAEQRGKAAQHVNTLWRPKRPDIDNLAKAILDALNGVAYADDAQVVMLTVRKRTAGMETAHGYLYRPGVEVSIREVRDEL